MTDHPLTDIDESMISQMHIGEIVEVPQGGDEPSKFLYKDMGGHTYWVSLPTGELMTNHPAANDQLEQVIKWLDENIANYHYRHYYDTGEYPRPNRRWDKLTEHLKEAMRPQEDS